MSRPDVVLISPYPLPGARHQGRSGVASYCANLASALSAGGAAIAVVAPEEPGAPRRSADGGVQVQRSFRRGAGAMPRAAAAALATGAPVAHLQHEFFLYGGPGAVPGLPLGLGAMRAAGAGPVVTMHHAVDPAAVDEEFMRLHRVRAPVRLGRAGLGSVQRTISRLARRVIVHEPMFARWIADATVIPHGLEAATGARPSVGEARASLGLEDRFTALCLGFIAPYKGLEVALEAAALAPRDVQLVVAGAEHPRLAASGDAYAEELRRRWAPVARFTGFVADAELPTLFAATDVALFLYPTVFSSSGALALALAHGTPVVLSPMLADSIGAPDAVRVALDPAALAARLRMLATDPGAADGLGLVSEALTRDRSWGEVARRHLDVYEEVIHARRASRRLVRAA